VQIGPRARSLLVLLNKHLGVTLRKTSSLLRNAFGLSITPGGVAHNLAHSARQTELTYEQLIDDVRRSPVVYADETSWWVNEPKWWLWTFTTPATTVYRVERRRNADVVHDTLREFEGLLVSDCLSSYDVAPYRKHKCVAHHLRAIKHARELPDTKDTRYLDRWKMLFQSLISLTHERERLSVEGFARRRGALERLADELLAEACVQSGDARVRNRLKKQRAHLFGCLNEPTAEATNNRAERSLRPAVIARKLSCGNRTEQGKRTFEILASLAATIHQRGEDLLAVLTKSLSLCPQAG
jgi:transposase